MIPDHLVVVLTINDTLFTICLKQAVLRIYIVTDKAFTGELASIL